MPRDHTPIFNVIFLIVGFAPIMLSSAGLQDGSGTCKNEKCEQEISVEENHNRNVECMRQRLL